MNKLAVFYARVKKVTIIFSKDGAYEGQVRSEAVEKNKCALFEKGRGPSGSFQNAWLWEKKEKELLLCKKRPTLSSWLYLTRFFLQEKKIIAASPHICGKDKYYAEIFLEETGFSILWRIEGPLKRQTALYSYR